MFRTNLRAVSPEGPVVVSLHEELDLADATAVAAILKALAAPDLWIIVNLSGLDSINAAGVAALSTGRRQARDAGGGLLRAAPQPQVRLELSLIWEADSSGVQASTAAAAASAESRPPIRLALPSGGSR